MKFSLVAIATMATAVMAAPQTMRRDEVSDSIQQLTDLVFGTGDQDLGVGEIVNGITSPGKRAEAIHDVSGLQNVLDNGLSTIQENTGAINSTLAQVKSGEISKDQAVKDVAPQLQAMHFKLTDILKQILDAAGINANPADLDRTLTLVTALLSEVLFTVKSLVTILGIRPQLASILHSLLGLVSNILTGLIALLGGLLPGLVTGLAPLLAGLGNGVLAPLLTGVAGLLAGLGQ